MMVSKALELVLLQISIPSLRLSGQLDNLLSDNLDKKMSITIRRHTNNS